MTTEEKIEQAANEYATKETDESLDYSLIMTGHLLHAECAKDFISGAKSDAAEEYWFEKFKKNKKTF